MTISAILVIVGLFSADVRTSTMPFPSLTTCRYWAPVFVHHATNTARTSDGETPFHVEHFCIEVPKPE